MSVRWAFEENTTDVLDVSKFQSLATEALREKEGWVGISGGYKQYNLLKLPQGKKLQRELAELAQSVLKALSKGPTNLVPKHFKLLKANPGSGPQAPHRDGLSKKHYVVAYYLSVNKSTDIAVTQDGWSAPLTSFPTVPGSLLVFREDMIHRGVKNEASEDRLVMFMVMGPPDVEHTDEYQHFEWTEIEDEQGSQSKAYYEALERNSQYKPLRHIANKAEKRKVERELRARKYARTAKKQ